MPVPTRSCSTPISEPLRVTDTILDVTGVTAGYVPDLPILKNLTLSAGRGRITALIGPNGAGKSTLLKAIAGLVPITSGRVRLDGIDITRLRPDRMADHGIAYVPQTDNVFRSLTVCQNLGLALRRAGRGAPERCNDLLGRFPLLAEKYRDRAGTLSGGQRQVLAVAMALASAPRLVLMDEPSAGLSPKATAEVLDLVLGLAGEGVSILLVEQNVKQALRIADHCYILAEGRNQVDGPAEALIHDRVVAEIYLGGHRVPSA